ncbi:hypothetical protein NC651_019058 [Populus alba x Populus x berolinensis]|nr:hypothetical protein NC651_019058 [Populus alba x Populus x berolinensis]
MMMKNFPPFEAGNISKQTGVEQLKPADFLQHCIQEATSTGGRGRKLIQYRLGWRTYGETRT